MKFLSIHPGKSTATLALALLAMMLGSGVVSALVAYAMGHEALKGVSQPDINPAKKIAENRTKPNSPQEFVPLDEKTILTQVYDRINNKDEKSDESAKKTADKDQESQTQSNNQPKTTEKPNVAAKLPIQVRDEGVTLEVVKTSQEGGSLLLNVNLSNKGSEPVRFLYSFLEVEDEQGRPLSAIADGLPGELPANGEKFSGTVKIPLELVSDEQKISLNLTDYPDQKLKLDVQNIPVVR
ncbi:MAG: hypothetical protein MUD14_04395 [Hydrococcus sp. Prado102]|jgi:hypothetical protein|nr:hypothetical protein [Hydrococcus sp. Prado102]